MNGEFLVRGFNAKIVACWKDVYNAGQAGRTIDRYKSVLGYDLTTEDVRELVEQLDGSYWYEFHEYAMGQLRDPHCGCGNAVLNPGELCPDCDSPHYDNDDDLR